MIQYSLKNLCAYLILLSLLITKGTIAQPSKVNIDSLKSIINLNLLDTTYVKAMIELASTYKAPNSDSGFYYANSALQVSRNLKFRKGTIKALQTLAIFNNTNGNYEKSLIYLDSINQIIDLRFDSLEAISQYMTRGNNNLRLGFHQKALEYYLKAIDIGEACHAYRYLCVLYTNLSGLYRKQLANLDLALKYVKKAEAVNKILKDDELNINIYEKIGAIYGDKLMFDSATFYNKISLYYAIKTNVIINQISQNINIGCGYIELGELDSAETYLHSSVIIGRSSKFKSWYARALIIYGDVLGKLNKSDSALMVTKEGLEIAKQIKEPGRIIEGYQTMIQLQLYKKDYKNAYLYRDTFQLIKDSMYTAEKTKNLQSLNVKYETEKKEAAITKLELDKKITALEIEKRNALIAGNLKEAKQKQAEIELLQQAETLNNLKIETQQSELVKQTLAVTAQQQQLKIAAQAQLLNERQLQNQTLIRNGIIAAFVMATLFGFVFFNRIQLKKKLEQQVVLEKERQRISSDLHDELGSGLTAIAMMSQSKNLAEPNTMNEISGTAHNLVDNMREMVWSLNTKNDSLENLIGYMHEYVSKAFQYSDIRLNVTLPDNAPDKTITGEMRRNIFLAVKECITNTLKYSQAKNVEFNVSCSTNKLALTIKDDGVGFDVNAIRKNASGLKNINNRITSIGGKVSINSSLGNGTETSMLLTI